MARYANEPKALALEEMPRDLEAKMRAFAKGNLTRSGRKALAQLLKTNPHWIPALTAEVMALRANSAA